MNKDLPIGYSQFGTPVVIWKENLAADENCYLQLFPATYLITVWEARYKNY